MNCNTDVYGQLKERTLWTKFCGHLFQLLPLNPLTVLCPISNAYMNCDITWEHEYYNSLEELGSLELWHSF